ncbi:hypothetical protein IscW_ISCW001281, partial [Ixodes scapularis]
RKPPRNPRKKAPPGRARNSSRQAAKANAAIPSDADCGRPRQAPGMSRKGPPFPPRKNERLRFP